MPQINAEIFIPEHELSFTCSRSGGPGGQHVNKVSSRVTLWFDLAGSPSLSEGDKERLRQRLASRINQEGRLWLVARASRSQHDNRQAAILRFARLLAEALSEDPARHPTRVPARSRAKRLQDKRYRAHLKRQGRGKVTAED